MIDFFPQIDPLQMVVNTILPTGTKHCLFQIMKLALYLLFLIHDLCFSSFTPIGATLPYNNGPNIVTTSKLPLSQSPTLVTPIVLAFTPLVDQLSVPLSFESIFYFIQFSNPSHLSPLYILESVSYQHTLPNFDSTSPSLPNSSLHTLANSSTLNTHPKTTRAKSGIKKPKFIQLFP